MQIGFIGFGKMGSRMVTKLLSEGHDVIGWNRSKEAISNFKFQISNFQYTKSFFSADSIEDLIKQLQPPRIVWLMLPAGEATEAMLSEIAKHVDPEDIVIDGGNAMYLDTQRRYETFAINNVRFLGIGVSGGVHALQNGYPLMVGGNKSAYEHIIPLLDSLSKPNGGHTYFGLGGVGHFVKMVHNGIEYGQMQAIGEGFGVLDKAPYEIDLLEVANLWQKNTIVSGFLIDRAKDALQKDAHLAHITGEIDASGEAEWTVEQAKKEEVPTEGIEQALEFRKKSKTDEHVKSSYAARMIAALRHEFGGHTVKKK